MSSRFPHSAEVRRDRFRGKRCDRGIERKHPLFLLAEPADRDGALGRFLAADHQQRRNLGERMLAHLVIDLLVAQVAARRASPARVAAAITARA